MLRVKRPIWLVERDCLYSRKLLWYFTLDLVNIEHVGEHSYLSGIVIIIKFYNILISSFSCWAQSGTLGFTELLTLSILIISLMDFFNTYSYACKTSICCLVWKAKNQNRKSELMSSGCALLPFAEHVRDICKLPHVL